MGLISPTLPTIGQPNATQDPDILSTLVALLGLVNGGLDTNNLAANANISAGQLAAGVIPAGTAVIPGTIIMYASTVAPSGYLLCDGTAVSRSTFSALFAVTGVSYGGGNGTTTFNVPDLVGRFPLGVGTATNPAPVGATAHAIGSKGGEETHVLSTPEMPSHTHPIHMTNGFTGAGGPFVSGIAGQKVANFDATDATGGGGAHNNLPQFTTVNFIIKT